MGWVRNIVYPRQPDPNSDTSEQLCTNILKQLLCGCASAPEYLVLHPLPLRAGVRIQSEQRSWAAASTVVPGEGDPISVANIKDHSHSIISLREDVLCGPWWRAPTEFPARQQPRLEPAPDSGLASLATRHPNPRLRLMLPAKRNQQYK